MMMKDIPGYEGQYAATDNGMIWSYKRQKYLTATIEKGYYRVSLCKNGNIRRWKVHILIANTFLTNPEGRVYINHKNGNKLDNSINNIEWAINAPIRKTYTRKSNARANREGGYNYYLRKPVYCVELDTTYDSITDAARILNLHHSGISFACSGRKKSTGGYHFQYADKP